MAQQSDAWPEAKWVAEGRSSTLQVPSLPESSRRRSAPSLLKGTLRHLRRTSSPGSVKLFGGPSDTADTLGLCLLHEPSDPLIDFIFVHGLGGGSRKSWSASQDPMTFWPKEWLPSEKAFRHVRIHSYGYDSDWKKSQQSPLTIHDFGQAMLADMYNAPTLKKNGDSPIVLISYSMGGLVVKKAYLLATRDPTYKDIASRIHSLYFLGTPHRGADSTQFVTAYLSMFISTGPKAFVKELLPGSGTLQAINDEFRHVCGNVQIWSFFEGAPTSTGPTSMMIVERESAVLGLPGEHTQYLQADHRHICKFETLDDPNYKTLLHCFGTTIQQIQQDYPARRLQDHKSQMKSISDALEIVHQPEVDLITILDRTHKGSCEWLTEHGDFQRWLDCDQDAVHTLAPETESPSIRGRSRFLWLSGPPGSGKSVASGNVVQYLQASNLDCAYFFCKSSARVSVAQMLSCLVFQMAELNFEVRRTILQMIQDGEWINNLDHTVIWNSIFLGRLFKIRFSQPQFWVIDALDECPSRALSSLLQMFAKIEPTIPLRVFVTSRLNQQIERSFSQGEIRGFELRTGEGGSKRDIAAFVRARLGHRPMDNDGGEDDIVSEVLEKSSGIFLWASLIISRLEHAYSVEAMRDALRQVPSEMSGLYTGILEGIKESPSAALAHCILRWVVSAPRPLSTDELKEAVRVDIGQNLRASAEFAHICGNLVTVDNKSCVQVMHHTVKEFLTSAQSDLYIERYKGHARLAEICLQQLNGRTFSPPRSRHALIPASNRGNGSDLDEYACANFSYHLSRSYPSASEVDLLAMVATFVTSNLLTWIERTAANGKLGHFTTVIQNLKVFVSRYVKSTSPLDPDYQLVDAMINDLARLLALFGPNLLETPSSIYSVIPPLCPTSSVFYEKFGKHSRQKLICSSNKDWDERLSCFQYTAFATAIACSNRYLAVGFTNGTIKVYSCSTLDLLSEISQGHGHPVRRLVFGTLSQILVSCSPKKIVLWGTSHTERWTASIATQPLSIGMNSDDSKLFVPTKDGVVRVFHVEDGAELEPIPLGGDSSDSDSDRDDQLHRNITPLLVRTSPTLDLTAITYRRSHLTLTNFEGDEKIGVFEKDGWQGMQKAPQILDMTFNPVLELNLMAVSYQDGEIVTLDLSTLEQKHVANLHTSVLASSPDGRTLAAGDNDGVIFLFAFETLRLMYRIASLEERILGIVFTSNSLRFFDIRRSACNVWEPSVLIRKNMADDSSSDAEEPNLPAPGVVFTRSFEGDRAITVITQAGDSNFVFCGREDGSITVHDWSAGKECLELRLHARMVDVSHLDWNPQANILLSVDVSGRCIATRFRSPPAAPWQQLERVVDHRASSAVSQALISPDGSSFLISSKDGEALCHASGATTASRHASSDSRWLRHPTDASRLLLIDGDTIHLFRWEGLKRETRDSGVKISLPDDLAGASTAGTAAAPPIPTLPNNWSSRPGSDLLAQVVRLPNSPSPTSVLLTLRPSHIVPATSTTIPTAILTGPLPASDLRTVVGLHRSSLFFLGRNGWVCSTSTKDGAKHNEGSYTRHFFIPPLWQTAGGGPIVRVVSKSSVVFAYRDDLIVFDGFLGFQHKVLLP
ncbi:hypothetical protein QBC33DRAFT_545297 [Phialemonium atrogriseum]|uniref:DUF676 domain-containing protein n=1 Tax=Phialemonium atrogriseum TaxID=1093897 RepID=A0AAJ0BV89_9PEZI|nr:uncharacterized protein QBC33DRAFT_545297 [Phialemonium atrogriseum]KAK1764935.1 hypothetical protein QBC33DRAFT_545297 [Phialemonium atrogriseum]